MPHVLEVVSGCQLQEPGCDHTPARLEELIGVVNLEGAHGVECMMENCAVWKRPEDDAVVGARSSRANASAVMSGIGESAHGLGGE